MAELKNRLKALRLDRNLSTSDIAQLLGVTERTVQHYENGDRKPSLEGITTLARFYKVTSDYLLGLSDEA